MLRKNSKTWWLLRIFRGRLVLHPLTPAAEVAISNASSLPPRLPYLSQVLKQIDALEREAGRSSLYAVVAVSYRSFWTSRGRPSQRGIELDAEAALQWIGTTFGVPSPKSKLLLWGQSIGAGVATHAAARAVRQEQLNSQHG